MSKKNTQKATRLIDIENNQIEKVLTACIALDNADLSTGKNSNRAKNLLEVQLYKIFCNQNEDTQKCITMHFKEQATIKHLIRCLPFIVGVNNFTISYDRKTKHTTLECFMLQPRGTYKNVLEEQGLVFVDDTKESEQKLETEKQEALAEANSILASYGLSAIQF